MYSLLGDVTPYSLGLGDKLASELKSTEGINPVNWFASRLKTYREEARIIRNHYSESAARTKLKQYIKARSQIEAGKGTESACEVARQIANQANISKVGGC